MLSTEQSIMRKENRELKKHLRQTTESVVQFIKWLDAEMVKPSTVDRGKRVARVASNMEFLNDRAMHFGLGMTFKQIENLKKKPLPIGASK